MSTIYAKSIIDGKFWIVEENNTKVGVLKLTDQQKYIFSSKNVVKTYDSKKKLFDHFGSDFFQSTTTIDTPLTPAEYNIQGYPTSTEPCAPMFDVKRHLPLFTKSEKSKSIYCAGYYIIKFDKKWTKSFCPKLITLERYPFEGPFKTELEMKNRLTHATK